MVCKFGKAEIRESYQDATVKADIDTLNAFRATCKRPDVEAFWIKGKGDDSDGPTLITFLVARAS
jgi:hypothetical protein